MSVNGGNLRALVLAHEPLGGGGEIERQLVARGVTVETHQITASFENGAAAEPFPDLDDYGLVLPMGSVRSLTEREAIGPWIEAELSLLAAAHDRGTPLLGVCFGGQVLAEALGGSVERAPEVEVGWYEIGDGPDGGNPVGPGPWFQWHHDRFTPPPEAETLAVSDRAVQLFRKGTTIGTQFHPEVDGDHVSAWLDHAPDDYLATLGVVRDEMKAEARAREAANRVQCGRLIDWVLDDVLG